MLDQMLLRRHEGTVVPHDRANALSVCTFAKWQIWNLELQEQRAMKNMLIVSAFATEIQPFRILNRSNIYTQCEAVYVHIAQMNEMNKFTMRIWCWQWESFVRLLTVGTILSVWHSICAVCDAPSLAYLCSSPHPLRDLNGRRLCLPVAAKMCRYVPRTSWYSRWVIHLRSRRQHTQQHISVWVYASRYRFCTVFPHSFRQSLSKCHSKSIEYAWNNSACPEPNFHNHMTTTTMACKLLSCKANLWCENAVKSWSIAVHKIAYSKWTSFTLVANQKFGAYKLHRLFLFMQI